MFKSNQESSPSKNSLKSFSRKTVYLKRLAKESLAEGKDNPEQHLAYPVVWKVLVDNFSHLGLLRLKHVWREEQDDVQHGSLRGQGCAAVLW